MEACGRGGSVGDEQDVCLAEEVGSSALKAEERSVVAATWVARVLCCGADEALVFGAGGGR